MAASLDVPAETETPPSGDASTRRRTRRLLPRFGLRSLLILLIVFSLLLGWVGRNLYRMRREEAALEAMLQAGATLVQDSGSERTLHPKTPAPFVMPAATSTQDWILGALIGTSPTPVAEVFMQGEDPTDPKVAAAVQALSAFPGTRFVELRGPAFDDRAIGPLSTLRELETLVLERTDLTGAGLSKLAPHSPLARLVVYDDEPDCDVAGAVPKFASLRSIALRGLPVAQNDFAKICSLPQLEEMELTHVQPSGGDQAFDLTSEMELFDGLGAYDAALDLSPIAGLPGLKELRLTNLDDGALARIGRLPTLRTLDVDGSVTLEAARAFSIANPECLVGHRVRPGEGSWLLAGEAVPGPPAK